ncbi:MAG: CNNM domain-containing protein [Endomicrobia bacterium]|nr:CNNM domain-containing protein [Endomicrobiia bacterium]
MIFLYILLLFFLSAFFSGSEAALTSLSDYGLRSIFFKNKFLRKPIILWIYRPYRYLISILVGNTVVNLILSKESTKLLMEQISIFKNRELQEILIWLFLTFIVIVFCELTPKIISKEFSLKISVLVFLPIYLFQYIVFLVFSPVLFLLEKYLEKEKIFYFAKIDELKKLLSETSKNMFDRSILEIFERVNKLDDVRIKDIYTPKEKVLAVDIYNKSIQNVIDEVIDTGKTRIPVYNRTYDKMLGYILVKDLFYICSTLDCSILDIIHPIIKIKLNDKAKELLKKFRETQIHIAVVVDNNDKFCGIVTLEDVIEEIVGDILDEYDTKPIRTMNKEY